MRIVFGVERFIADEAVEQPSGHREAPSKRGKIRDIRAMDVPKGVSPTDLRLTL